MIRAIVYLPPRELTRWLNPCTQHCLDRNYEIAAVVSHWQDALRMLLAEPQLRLVTATLDMVPAIEVVTGNPRGVSASERRPQRVHPERASQRRPVRLQGDPPPPTLRAVA